MGLSGKRYTLKGDNSVKLFYIPSKNRSTIKGKNLLLKKDPVSMFALHPAHLDLLKGSQTMISKERSYGVKIHFGILWKSPLSGPMGISESSQQSDSNKMPQHACRKIYYLSDGPYIFW